MYQMIHFLCLLLVSSTVSIHAQESLSPSVQVQIEILSEALIVQSKIPGISISVSKNNKLVYANGFGFADVDNHLKMTPLIRLRAASVSKVITATALGRLATDGKLDFDVPIKQYVPYINEAYAKLTTRQLAGHTAGLAHRPGGQAYKNKQFNKMQETVELMDAPLLFEPDTKYQYSTHAFNLLAAVIEGASGETYANYMQQSIFDPLQMTNTYAENIEELGLDDAKLYYVKNDKLKKERVTNASYKLPGAGFRTTPSDLVKMMQAYSNGFISKKVVDEMFASHHLKNGDPTQVGIAWRSSIDAFNHRVIEHAGSWLGARTVIVHWPEENMNISLMVNASCTLLIEETAHIFAEIIRNSSISTSTLKDIQQDIEVTFNSEEGVKRYQGTLKINGNNGMLNTNNEGFLKEASLHYLGSTNNYAMATSYGLLYVHLSDTNGLEGKLYTYYNRRSNHPTTDLPLVTFK